MSYRCRKGTAEILIDFDDFSAIKNKNETLSDKDITKYQICGKDLPRGYWVRRIFNCFFFPILKYFVQSCKFGVCYYLSPFNQFSL